jgi:hypothetical protein
MYRKNMGGDFEFQKAHSGKMVYSKYYQTWLNIQTDKLFGFLNSIGVLLKNSYRKFTRMNS